MTQVIESVVRERKVIAIIRGFAPDIPQPQAAREATVEVAKSGRVML